MTMTQVPAPTREALAMAPIEGTELPATGLCGTCDARTSCVLRSSTGRPVWDCSEYSDGSRVTVAPRPVPSVEDAGAYQDARGLCVNCDLVAGCAFRTPGQVVLRCEEYR